jgi:hypothetical protein
VGAPRCSACSGGIYALRARAAITWRHIDGFLDGDHEAVLFDPLEDEA